jgi:L-galactose dehydrogenase
MAEKWSTGLQAPRPPADERFSSTQEIEYRQLGNTPLLVSVVGFGASPLGNVFSPVDPTDGTAAVQYAIDRGINFFDVSPYYGLTLAETRLGQALAGRRGQVVLATKCGRYGTSEFDFSASRIKRSVEESLGRLRTDYVDLLQAHDVEFGEVAQIVEETVPALRRLQEEGKARYIGITGYSPANLVAIAERVKVDSILTYCRYNLMIADIDDVLVPFAKQHDVGIVNASPLHMGILTKQGPPEWHPAPPEVREAGRRIVELCAAEGVDTPALALRFCLGHPYVASTLVGMSTRKQVEANLKVLSMASNPVLLEQIRQVVAPVSNCVWPSGREENRC